MWDLFNFNIKLQLSPFNQILNVLKCIYINSFNNKGFGVVVSLHLHFKLTINLVEVILSNQASTFHFKYICGALNDRCHIVEYFYLRKLAWTLRLIHIIINQLTQVFNLLPKLLSLLKNQRIRFVFYNSIHFVVTIWAKLHLLSDTHFTYVDFLNRQSDFLKGDFRLS